MKKKTKLLIFSIPFLAGLFYVQPWQIMMLSIDSLSAMKLLLFYSFAVTLYVILEYLYSKNK